MSEAAVAVDAAGLLAELLSVASPTGAVAAAAVVLAERMRALGFAVECDAAGNVIGSWGAGPTEVMLVGHLDTVPGQIPVRREGTRLHGRGAVDAKGPLVTAVAAVAAQPRNARHRFTVVAVPDEEGDSHGARALASRPAPDHLVILEPSGWDAVTIGYRGCVRARIEVSQDVAHGAGGLPSAPDRIIGAVHRLQDRAAERNAGRRQFDCLDVRVTAISSASDGLRESCRAAVVLRLPPGLPADEAVSLLERAAQEGGGLGGNAREDAPQGDTVASTADGHASAAPAVAVDYRCAAVRAAKGSALARRFVAAIRASGGVPRYKVKTGTADMNVLVPEWGCPTLAYGPGDSHLDHTPREAIDLVDLDRAIAVVTAALAAL